MIGDCKNLVVTSSGLTSTVVVRSSGGRRAGSTREENWLRPFAASSANRSANSWKCACCCAADITSRLFRWIPPGSSERSLSAYIDATTGICSSAAASCFFMSGLSSRS
jgi:hypothetical protein